MGSGYTKLSKMMIGVEHIIHGLVLNANFPLVEIQQAKTSAPTAAQKWTVLTMGKWVPLGGSKNPVGWCCLHRFTLSVNQMKRKRCLIKDCRHFRKKKEHNYWKAKERAEQARKERKNDAT